MASDHAQDKTKEIAFFDAHAEHDAYDVFTPQANERIIAAFVRLSRLPRGARVADLGCGSGVFTELLRRQGFQSVGLDISRSGGRFVAFDPNRMNPFMWLYRDRSSPFYSSVGVTENERPILAWRVADIFRNEGFRVQSDHLAGLAYRYVASGRARALLPVYNFIDTAVFNLGFMSPFRPFVLTSGEKP